MPTMSQVESLFCRSAPWRALARHAILPWALQSTRLDGQALEIGAGSGAMAAEVLRAHPYLRMTVTDYDDEMVSAAARRLTPYSDRVTACRADASSLSFASGSFDAVVSFIMLHHTAAWEQALAEAVRGLKPGGTLLGYDLLSRWPARTLHRLEGAPHRLVEPGELGPVLARLPVRDVRVRTGFCRSVVRFSASKTGSNNPARDVAQT